MYRLELNYISRSGGKKRNHGKSKLQEHGFTATAAIAYRTGSIVADYRTGEVHDYRRKARVGHVEIVLPIGAPPWASAREALWNAVEAAEVRKDARVANEFIVCLPHGLGTDQEIQMVRELTTRIVVRHGIAAEFAIHDDDPKHWNGVDKGIVGRHAHILMTTRAVTADGLSVCKAREFTDQNVGPRTLRFWREQWAVIGNKYLEQAGSQERWDHRTLVAQRGDALARGDIDAADALDRTPGVHLGAAATAMERAGMGTYIGDLNRAILAKNEGRKLGYERKRLEDSLAGLERRLSEIRIANEEDKLNSLEHMDDPRWPAFEKSFLIAAQFEYHLSMIEIAAPLAELKAQFSPYMDTAEERGMSTTEFAKALAKGMADRDRQQMQEQTAQPEIHMRLADDGDENCQLTP